MPAPPPRRRERHGAQPERQRPDDQRERQADRQHRVPERLEPGREMRRGGRRVGQLRGEGRLHKADNRKRQEHGHEQQDAQVPD